jgi:hypothetical protein
MRNVKLFVKQYFNTLLFIALGILLDALAVQVLTGLPGFILFIVGTVSLLTGIFLLIG